MITWLALVVGLTSTSSVVGYFETVFWFKIYYATRLPHNLEPLPELDRPQLGCKLPMHHAWPWLRATYTWPQNEMNLCHNDKTNRKTNHEADWLVDDGFGTWNVKCLCPIFTASSLYGTGPLQFLKLLPCTEFLNINTTPPPMQRGRRLEIRVLVWTPPLLAAVPPRDCQAPLLPQGLIGKAVSVHISPSSSPKNCSLLSWLQQA